MLLQLPRQSNVPLTACRLAVEMHIANASPSKNRYARNKLITVCPQPTVVQCSKPQMIPPNTPQTHVGSSMLHCLKPHHNHRKSQHRQGRPT